MSTFLHIFCKNHKFKYFWCFYAFCRHILGIFYNFLIFQWHFSQNIWKIHLFKDINNWKIDFLPKSAPVEKNEKIWYFFLWLFFTIILLDGDCEKMYTLRIIVWYVFQLFCNRWMTFAFWFCCIISLHKKHWILILIFPFPQSSIEYIFF